MTTPAYVRRGGLDVAPPPWQCDDIEASVFYVDGDTAALRALCDRTLNAPSGGRLRYEPLAGIARVALTFQRFKGLRSTSTASAATERHDYCEASVWVMVEDAAAGRGPELLIPYMFIDDWVELAAGREVIGFPKELAAVSIPPPEAPARYAVEGLAVAPGASDARVATIMECVARGNGEPRVAGALRDRWAEVPSLIAVDGPLAKLGALLRMFLKMRLDCVFLRQVRALGGGPGADLQQVVAARVHPFTVRSLHLLPAYELRLPALASHPIASDLGIRPGPGDAVPVPCAFRCKLSFVIQPGTTLAA